MTNPDTETVETSGQRYRKALAEDLADRRCPGCVADHDKALCDVLSKHGCYDAEQRELVWLKVE